MTKEVTKIEVSNAQINNCIASYDELESYLSYLRKGGSVKGMEAIGFENFAKAILEIKSAADKMSRFITQELQKDEESE